MELENKQVVIGKKVEELEEIINEQRLEMERNDEELANRLDQTVNEVSTSITRIFFTARPSTAKSYGENQTIVFDMIVSTGGGGYDAASGVFTEPRSGVYLFSFAMKANVGYENVHLLKNGNPIAKMVPDGRGSGDGDSGHETAAVTVVVDLAKGSKVCIVAKGYGGGKLGNISMFTGVMIQQ